MVFKKLKASLGGGGAAVETTLNDPRAYPGGAIEGTVQITGGEVQQDVKYLEVGLTARVEVETDDSEHESNLTFHRHRITGEFQLEPGARHQVPFRIDLPWETPFNVVDNTELHKVRIGVRTELEIARSVDKGDVDPIHVYPLPAQQRLLGVFEQIGFRFKGSDLERGRIPGAELPLYQELEFAPPPQYASRINEIEVKFIARPSMLEVILEFDRRGLFGSADRANRFTVDYATLDQVDWATQLDQHVRHIAQAGGLLG